MAGRAAVKLPRTVVDVEGVLVAQHVHQRLPLQAAHWEPVPRLVYHSDLHPATISIRRLQTGVAELIGQQRAAKVAMVRRRWLVEEGCAWRGIGG